MAHHEPISSADLARKTMMTAQSMARAPVVDSTDIAASGAIRNHARWQQHRLRDSRRDAGSGGRGPRQDRPGSESTDASS
ncbi:hypothetical protein [Paraburkholderia sp. DGU8]|uniref:hypothetical protein n=1 Tax=Paraburkholderia sp. DGU8 TaxID=3161997 RepID=UPI003466D803